jgi:hypothetical protein
VSFTKDGKKQTMCKKLLLVAAAVIALSGVANAKSDDPPNMTHRTISYVGDGPKSSNEDCKNYAVKVLSKVGAKEKDIFTAEKSVWGTVQFNKHAYSISVVCVMKREIIFFSVAGKGFGEVNIIADGIRDAWKPDTRQETEDDK